MKTLNVAKQAYLDYVARCVKAGAEFCDFDRFKREWRQVQAIEAKETKLDFRQIHAERRTYTWLSSVEAPIRRVNPITEDESHE